MNQLSDKFNEYKSIVKYCMEYIFEDDSVISFKLKQIDYSLRNPKGIKKIESYELPSDDDLIKQGIDQIICETCFLYEQCNKVFCMRDNNERIILQEQMLEAANTIISGFNIIAYLPKILQRKFKHFFMELCECLC